MPDIFLAKKADSEEFWDIMFQILYTRIMGKKACETICRDVGEPLFVTPLLEAGQWKKAQVSYVTCMYSLCKYSLDRKTP